MKFDDELDDNEMEWLLEWSRNLVTCTKCRADNNAEARKQLVLDKRRIYRRSYMAKKRDTKSLQKSISTDC